MEPNKEKEFSDESKLQKTSIDLIKLFKKTDLEPADAIYVLVESLCCLCSVCGMKKETVQSCISEYYDHMGLNEKQLPTEAKE